MTSQSAADAILRSDPTAFIERTFQTVSGSASYMSNWHIEAIAYQLERCRKRKTKRLIITVPPRNLKSICASVAFPALILGKDPKAQVICVSYSQDLSSKLARDCRTVLQSEWYRRIFPGTCLNPDKMAADEFETTAGGYRLATSIGGVLTGRGADYIIIDDPMKPDDADSETKRLAVNNWYDSTLCSRLNNKNEGVIILVMQRLHLDDLVAHVAEAEEWTKIDIPAIAPHEQGYRLSDHEVHARRRGDLLHPERESKDVLDGLRKRMGSRYFEAQYQQNPVPAGGAIIRPEWFGTYTTTPQLESFEGIVQVWDTASKTSLTHDFSACTTWGMLGDKLYLLDVHRGRYEFPELRRLVIDHAWEWHADRVAIEDAGSGMSLIQDLGQRGDLRVDKFSPRGEKVERVNGQTAKIEAGRVLLPTEAPWLTTFLDEVRAFPSAKYDDQVDSMANFLMRDLQFAQLIKNGGRKWTLRSKNPARPGVEPAGTARVTVIGARRLWER